MRIVILSLGLMALVGCVGPQKLPGLRLSLHRSFQWRLINRRFRQVRSTAPPIQTVGLGRRKHIGSATLSR